MIPTTDDLQGTWVSRNFAMYTYDDDFEFTFHFGKYATLYFSKGGNHKTITEGIYEIENLEEENFNILVDGNFIELPKTILNAKLYIQQLPPCFVMLVPEYGFRYFQKK